MTDIPFSEAIEAERLRQLRALLETTLREFDVCAQITLAGRGGRAETFLQLDASWSRVSMEGGGFRLRSMKADYAGDVERQKRDLQWTLGALSNLAELTGRAGVALLQVAMAFDNATGAEHTPLQRDDPRDG